MVFLKQFMVFLITELWNEGGEDADTCSELIGGLNSDIIVDFKRLVSLEPVQVFAIKGFHLRRVQIENVVFGEVSRDATVEYNPVFLVVVEFFIEGCPVDGQSIATSCNQQKNSANAQRLIQKASCHNDSIHFCLSPILPPVL